MKSAEIRKKFLRYFEKRKHVRVPSSSLIPSNDPSVLLTSAGMQQFLPHFLGQADPKKDFGSRRATSVQKCFRTSDIEAVGDANHLTFFEMLGNFSFGDYFKEGAIDYAFDFLTATLKLDPNRLWATAFAGDGEVERDMEAITHWQKIVSKHRVTTFGRSENWWGPPGKSGPCGPSSEVHYDLTHQACYRGTGCVPNCDCGRFVEIWNLVFMQFHVDRHGKFTPLKVGQIDTGMGLERVAAATQGKLSVFDTDAFAFLIDVLKRDQSFGYEGVPKRFRIVADHLRGVVFLLGDGVLFSNKEQGYIARRVFRRALDQFRELPVTIEPYVEAVVKHFGGDYPELKERRETIIGAMNQEIAAYGRIARLKIEEVYRTIKPKGVASEPARDKPVGPSARQLTAAEAFKLYSTYGLSLARLKDEGYQFDEQAFNTLVAEHKALSRAGSQRKFGGHGIADESAWAPEQLAIMKTYHSATHLLHEALRRVLGEHVKQEGSDINPKRLRFDFRHPVKLTDAELKKIEALVNEQIKRGLPVSHQSMGYAEAIKAGALAFFKERYPDQVTVYSIGDFSKEICGGPHVSNTSDIKGTFKITSEKSVAAGIRRIKAIVK